ncbi:sodium:proton antiporter [Halothermothrix orenii]|uniref:NADH dehydrogenase I subunit K n=1 Tax=Halothermothrix orenii (strain H 168 / OCM 544 / DSM 9562) TaxID=373903 RepID=B8CXD8_HALOH|nr:cation:proton antiporter subunit C [Halothermothrix orenii]ACL69957.1 NADH dehydrogenase I subunit K [Halothermothrix orenii H 168]
MLYHLVFILLFMLGFYTLLTKKNLIKIVIGLNIMEASVLFWLIAISDRGKAPIMNMEDMVEKVSDPLPQALALTAIVIGASTTALLLTLIIELSKHRDTVNIDELKGLDD